MAEVVVMQSPGAQTLFLFFFSFCWPSFPLTDEAEFVTAWAVFQDDFSVVFETIIVSGFLCLPCLLQLPTLKHCAQFGRKR